MIRPVGLCILAATLSAPALAQDLVIYPAEGQSKDQTEKDRFECYTWGRDNSGFDPMAPPTTSSPPPRQKQGGGTGQGAVTGGLIGGAIGGITQGSRKGLRRGAAAGAISGGVLGTVRSSNRQRQNEQRQQDWERQEVASYSQGRNDYNRAFSACMTGRGYTVG